MYRMGCHLAWSFFGSLNALLLYGQEKSKRGMDEGLHHTTIRDRPPPHHGRCHFHELFAPN